MMRFRVSAKVEGHGSLEDQWIVDVNGDSVVFTPGSSGLLEEVAVSRSVPEYHTYLPSVQRPKNDLPLLSFPTPPVAKELVELMQHIESLGSFWMHIHKVHWESAKLEWLPENEEERSAIEIFSVATRYSFDIEPRAITKDSIRQVLLQRQERAYLVIPMAFFREGMNDHRELRYVNGFYNFYFFLEALYGKGKTKNIHVERALMDSADVRLAVGRMLNELEPRSNGRHYQKILEWLSMRSLPYTTEAAIKLLVWMRGNLHHFSPRSATPKWHPFNQREYESLSYFTMGVCVSLLPKLMAGR